MLFHQPVGLGGSRVNDELHLAEILGIRHPALRPRMDRRHHESHPVPEQRPVAFRRADPRPQAEHDVEIMIRHPLQQLCRVVRLDRRLAAREAIAELAQHRGQQELAKRMRRADPDPSLAPALQPVELAPRVLQLAQHPAAAAQEDLALLGQHRLLAEPV
jgi:hypothetical protein